MSIQDGPITTYRQYQFKTPKVATIISAPPSTDITIAYPTVSPPETTKSKRYYTRKGSPTCNRSTPQYYWNNATNNTVVLRNQDNGAHVCTSLTVANTTDRYEVVGYSTARLVIPPTVAFASQNKNALTLTYDPTNVATKQYYTASPGANNRPTCNETDTTTNWTTIADKILTLPANTPAGQWVCVRVTNSLGFSGYTTIQFQRESSPAEIIQSDYKFYVSPGNNRTCADNDADEIVECKYFKSQTDPNCTASIDSPSESNKWNTFSKGVLTDTYSANQYICVKIKNKIGYYTYSERKAITMMVIAINRQTSNKIRVTYQHASRALGTTKYYTQATEPTCDYSTFNKRTTAIDDNSHWTGEIPNGWWVCISAQNYNISVQHKAWSFLKVKDI